MLGLTQAGPASVIRVSCKTNHTLQNGVFVPPTVIALKFAAALGEPVEALFALVCPGVE